MDVLERELFHVVLKERDEEIERLRDLLPWRCGRAGAMPKGLQGVEGNR